MSINISNVMVVDRQMDRQTERLDTVSFRALRGMMTESTFLDGVVGIWAKTS